jgi:hypothetical protein
MDLQSLYTKYNHVGANKLYQLAKREGLTVSYKDIADFLKKQRVAQVFKKVPKKRGFIVAFHPDERMQMDLIDMTKFATKNSGYGWILLVVDIFTRRCMAYLLKKKTEGSIHVVLEKFFKTYHPEIIISDNESGFKSRIVQHLMDDNSVDHQMVEPGDHRALGVIDRAVQTIKNALYKGMKDKNTAQYSKLLPRIIEAYNNTPNLGIENLSPSEAAETQNVETLQILNHQKENVNFKNRQEFTVGDVVRVRLKQTAFKRSYDETYSEKTYTIEDIQGQYAVLDNGERVNTRRLVHATVIEERTRDVVAETKKENKIKRALAREHLEIDNKEYNKPSRRAKPEVLTAADVRQGKYKKAEVDKTNILASPQRRRQR